MAPRGVFCGESIHDLREEPLTKIKLAAITPLAIALVAAGCGSSSNKTASTATTPAKSGAYGAPSNSSSSSSTKAALITTKHAAKLGTILAYGSKNLTVYLFEADKAGRSNCTGACASVWTPVTGSPHSSGAAMSADLGTIKRSDGTTQVTYKGHPLYLYTKDKDDGDTYGQGVKAFGADWYTLSPSGNKVDLS
jgi:predicted lipoprotein with Yx(FWY)xxD motif